MRLILLIACGMIAIAATTSYCQERIDGTLFDAITKEPVVGATVKVRTKEHKVLKIRPTDTSGRFFFPITVGQYEFFISALGYKDTIVKLGVRPIYRIGLESDRRSIGEVVVTAQGHTTAIQDVPVSVSTVKDAEILSRGSFAIDDALRWIPGVTVTESEVNIRGSSGYSRGVGSRVLFLLDGMPLLSGDNGDIKFDVLPMLDIDRIEVVKGAGSALYGSSALGGVINVITREPTDTLRTAITTLGGIYDQPKYPQWRVPGLGRRFASVEAGASGTAGDIGILGTVVYRRNEGYRLGDDSYKQDGFFKVDAPLGGHTKLVSSLLLANEDHGGWLYWSGLSSPLMPGDSLSAVNGRIHSFKANFRTSAEITNEHTSEKVSADVYYTDFTTDPTIPGGSQGPHSAATNGMLEYDFNADLAPVFFSSGVILNGQRVNSDLFTNHTGVSFAAFAQGEYHIDPLIITAGFRADALHDDNEKYVSQLSPKLGLSYEVDDHLSFRGSFGGGFRAPSIGERFVDQVFSGFPVKPNPDLTPETSYSSEIGGSYRTPTLYLDGAVFYSSFNDLIEPSFVTTGTNSYIQFQNITKAEIAGHEEVLEYYPFGNNDLSLRLGYTYVYPKNKVTNQVLEFRPRNLLQSRIGTEIGSWSGSVEFRYISKYESVDSVLVQQVPDGGARVDAYILDARLGYDLRQVLDIPLKLTFQVENLLNYYYVEIAGNLAPLRNYSLRLESVF